jgi:hypothetical protein
MLSIIETWAFCLYPHSNFEDFMKKMDVLSSKYDVKVISPVRSPRMTSTGLP